MIPFYINNCKPDPTVNVLLVRKKSRWKEWGILGDRVKKKFR